MLDMGVILCYHSHSRNPSIAIMGQNRDILFHNR